MVHRRARTLLGTDEEARDAMQEVFVRILSAHSEFRGDAPILHWIYRITTHVCLDRLRKRKTHPIVSDPEAVAQLLATPGDPVDRRAILQVLARTDRTTQEIAVHYYLDGLPMEEVAGLVGLSRKTVGKKLEAFKKRAAQWLGGKG